MYMYYMNRSFFLFSYKQNLLHFFLINNLYNLAVLFQKTTRMIKLSCISETIWRISMKLSELHYMYLL